MPQHSYDITSLIAKGGMAYRAAVNAAFQALVSNNLGETAAATLYEGMGQFFDEGTTWTYKFYTGVEGHEWVTILTIDLATGTVTFSEEGIAFATASEALAGAAANKVLSPATFNAELVKNLKPTVNASVNKLDLLTKSGGAVPDSDNVITVAIPDGNGYTFRSRSGSYLSGTSQFILADATAYWGAVSGSDKVKLHEYAIWDGTGIVWALSRYAGFHKVPTTTTPGDSDYFLLEDGSTYTRSASHHCVCVGENWTNYNTDNTPDWTFYDATTDVALAPQIIWNPRSDWSQKKYASYLVQASDIAPYSAIAIVLKQPGKYQTKGAVMWQAYNGAAHGFCNMWLKVGSATYADATTVEQFTDHRNTPVNAATTPYTSEFYANAGDTVHLGLNVVCDGAYNRAVYAATNMIVSRAD